MPRPLALAALLAACADPGPAAGDTDAAHTDAVDTDPVDTVRPRDTGRAPACEPEPQVADTGRSFDPIPPVDDTADGAPVGEDTGDWPRVSTPPPTGLCTDDGWCWATSRPHALTLTDVHGTGPDDVWVVGVAGLVQHFDGDRWSYAWIEPGVDLNAVWADAGGPCVAGDGGVLRCRQGGRWVALDPPGGDRLTHLTRAPGGALWVAGEQGVYERRGGTWVVHATPGGPIRAVEDDDVWVADDRHGTGLHRWDGRAWTTVPDAPVDPVGLDGLGPGDLWVATSLTLHHLQDGALRPMPLPGALDTGIYRFRVLGPDRVVLLDRSGLWISGPSGWLSHRFPVVLRISASAVWGASADAVWLPGPAGRLTAWDGRAFTVQGPTSPSGPTQALAVAPLGGVLLGLDGALQRLEGDVLREVFRPDHADEDVSAIRVDGRRLWVSATPSSTPGDGGGFGLPSYDALHRRDARGAWHHGWSAGWGLWGTRGALRVWTGTSGCRFVRQTVEGGDPGPSSVASWPTALPPCEASACDVQRVDPLHEVWGVAPALGAGFVSWDGGPDPARVWHHDGARWSTWTLPPGTGAVRMVDHPVTGALGLVTASGTWARLDLATGGLVDVVPLAAPGEVVVQAFGLPGEVVVVVQPSGSAFLGIGGGRLGLLRWDGETVRREALPADGDVRALVQEPDGRTWALAGGHVLVQEPR